MLVISGKPYCSVLQAKQFGRTSSSCLTVIGIGVCIQEGCHILKILMLTQTHIMVIVYFLSCLLFSFSYCLSSWFCSDLSSPSSSVSCPCVHRWAGRCDHVPSFPAGPSHDSQGAWVLEWCYRHGLLHLWVFSGRPATLSVQVTFITVHPLKCMLLEVKKNFFF